MKKEPVPCDGCLLLPLCVQRYPKAIKFYGIDYMVMKCQMLYEYTRHPVFIHDEDIRKEASVKEFFKNLLDKKLEKKGN